MSRPIIVKAELIDITLPTCSQSSLQ